MCRGWSGILDYLRVRSTRSSWLSIWMILNDVLSIFTFSGCTKLASLYAAAIDGKYLQFQHKKISFSLSYFFNKNDFILNFSWARFQKCPSFRKNFLRYFVNRYIWNIYFKISQFFGQKVIFRPFLAQFGAKIGISVPHAVSIFLLMVGPNLVMYRVYFLLWKTLKCKLVTGKCEFFWPQNSEVLK